MNEVKVYLTLSGNRIDINLVDSLLGIAADSVRSKNEVLKNGRLFGHDEWSINSGTVLTNDVTDAFKKVVSRVNSNSYLLKQIATNLDAEWGFLVLMKVYDEIPLIYFPNELLRFAGEIGADIGFDSYLLV